MAKVTKFCHETSDGRGIITASNGVEFKYELRKVRKWNIGLRRHGMALTGDVTVIYPGGYAHYSSFDSAFADIEKYAPIELQSRIEATQCGFSKSFPA